MVIGFQLGGCQAGALCMHLRGGLPVSSLGLSPGSKGHVLELVSSGIGRLFKISQFSERGLAPSDQFADGWNWQDANATPFTNALHARSVLRRTTSTPWNLDRRIRFQFALCLQYSWQERPRA